MDALRRFLLDLTERYQAMPGVQRMLVVAGIGGGILALVFWGFIGVSSDYGVLFSNLAQDDAAAITGKLKGKKVAYRLEGGGGTILVPRSEVYELRLYLASEGMPRGGGVGFELFDRQGLGTTDFVQRLNYQRALQGELARTISGIPEVAEARVHIVTPKESLFVEDQKKATAAVAVKLRQGRGLSPAQIDGIVNLVSSAVPDLHPSQVTVVDLNGRILSKPQDVLTPGGLSTAQMTFQRQAEESLERKVQSLFDQILGSRKSIVRVSADLDFQKIDIREESFTPNKELVRSEQKTMERSSRGQEAAGTPEGRFDLSKGTITAPPPGKGPPPLSPPVAAAPTGPSGTERQSELKNYEINRVLRQVVDQPGKIKRLSVAVVVDGVYKGKGNAFSPRPPEEMRQFAGLAKKAIGYSSERGDQFEISSAPLALQTPEGVVAAGSGFSWRDTLMDSAKIGLMVLFGLAVLMMLLKKRPVSSRRPLLEAPPAPGLSAYERQAGALSMGGEAALPPPKLQPPPISLPDAVDGKEKVVQLINTYPDRAVEVLRLWLHEK
ncbi:MAG: flagellar M-ring protein FliF [Deltaproteobacteria bacterium RBG_13_60_28]|nr:MAG: flagellar M-ring protein FliF [Deltaproteobacteria bacterium RBG_13_60_28]